MLKYFCNFTTFISHSISKSSKTSVISCGNTIIWAGYSPFSGIPHYTQVSRLDNSSSLPVQWMLAELQETLMLAPWLAGFLTLYYQKISWLINGSKPIRYISKIS
jgi:hypothetical protein